MKHPRILLLALLVFGMAMAGCGTQPEPVVDLVATQIAVEEAAHATMTARAPTDTDTPQPTDTPAPTSTPVPTDTPVVPTATPEPTETDTPTPTDTPSPTATEAPTAVAWSTLTSSEQGFSMEYPDGTIIEGDETGWSLGIPGEWAVAVNVFDRDTDAEIWDTSLVIITGVLMHSLLEALDLPSTNELETVDEGETDAYGSPGYYAVMQTPDESTVAEVLVVRSATRAWLFLFVSTAPEAHAWTDQAMASIVLDIPPEDAATEEDDTASEESSASGQRDDPVPFGEKLGLVLGSDKKFYLTITEAYQGEEAWSRILDANRFNDPPLDGMEYLLLYVQIDYAEGPSDEPLQLDLWDFNVVSKGQIIEVESIVPPEPEFDISFFPGASGGGWMAWPMIEGDEVPMLVAGMKRDGTGGFYFEALP